MDTHTLEVLEYNKIKSLVGRYLKTGLGGEVLSVLKPESNLEQVRDMLRLTSEARRSVDQLLEPALDPVHDLRPYLDLLKPEGTFLEGRQLLQVRDTLRTIRRTVEFFSDMPAGFDRLKQLGKWLTPQDDLADLINRTIDEEAQVRDSASRRLKGIRSKIREGQDWITRRLNRMIRKRTVREMLQEPYYTIREGRYVLPVQSKFKGKLRGIVHDYSDTGTTTFIEPAEIVEQGNRLRELYSEEQVEIRKILRQLAGQVRQAGDPIRSSLSALAEIDFTYAKARCSAVLKMQEPEVAESGPLKIRSARHPFLVEKLKDKVVPLDLVLGDQYRSLVITGPNAGGKTVALKTIGAVCLMAASGFHTSTGDGTRILLYQEILADIGDEQSMDQNLSTFTSHIQKIKGFLAQSSSRTLVMLDELGAGTDPVEGGALGVAMLEALHERGGHTLITTHLSELKVYAYQTEGVENAAMAFNTGTLEPTYRIEPGTAGSSYALEIAGRQGLPGEIVQAARRRLERGEDNPEKLLERLSNDTRMSAEARRQSEDEKQKIENVRLELAKRLDRVEREKGQTLERYRVEARKKLDRLEEEIRETRQRLEELLQKAEEAGQPRDPIFDAAMKDVEKLGAKEKQLRKTSRKAFAAEKEAPNIEPVRPEELQPGQLVGIQGFARPAEILSIDSRKNEAEVAAQSIHIRVPLRRIVGIVKQENKPRPEKSTVNIDMTPKEELPHSIDIHGMTREEALPIIEKFLDRANLGEWREVYIIHGQGYGVLRNLVRRTLDKHPLIKSYRPGDSLEGGTGVTVATLYGS